MSVTLNLPPETERRLRERAARSGQTLEGYLEHLAGQAAAGAGDGVADGRGHGCSLPTRAAGHAPRPSVADDSREGISAGRGEGAPSSRPTS